MTTTTHTCYVCGRPDCDSVMLSVDKGARKVAEAVQREQGWTLTHKGQEHVSEVVYSMALLAHTHPAHPTMRTQKPLMCTGLIGQAAACIVDNLLHP